MLQEDAFQLYVLKDETTEFKSYTYAILDQATHELLIIDPSCEKEKLSTLIASTHAIPRYILLTHTHLDHIRQLEWLRTTYPMQVCLAEAEAQYYDFYVPNMLCLQDGMQLHLGETIVTALHTPGHSKGSMCYQIGQNLFTGDTLFIEGCGLCTAPGGSPDEMYASLQKLKQLLTKDTIIYPGHRYQAELGQTLQYVLEHNIYMVIEDLPTFIRFRMRKNQVKLYDFQ